MKSNSKKNHMKIKYFIMKLLPGKLHMSLIYRREMGKKLNFRNPNTFNEKLQWLKFHDRKKEYTQMVDKYAVREFIAQKIGEDYLIELVGGPWESFDDINFEELPDKFVLKCTHDSGSVAICLDKNNFDLNENRKKFQEALGYNFYYFGREFPYKNVKPRLIAEKYMEDNEKEELVDYKIHCFNGVPKLILVCCERNSSTGVKKIFYDTEWNKLNIKRPKSDNSNEIAKPDQLDEMLRIAEILSDGIVFLRVDLYVIKDKVYFGELTFYPSGGTERFEPDGVDEMLGDWLILPGRKGNMR